MNKTLYQLAYRNIKKFKKHYMIVSFIVLLMSIFFMTFMMTWSQSYEVKKTYNMEKYGTWYVWTSIDFQEKEIIEELIEKQPYSPLYGYYYHQGFDNNGKTIGYMENTLYKMCHLQLNKGRYPQNTQEIMVSSSYMNENNYHINQVISLSIQGSPITDYTIVGMIEKSQNIFPDIYTNIQGSGDIQLISDGIIGQKDLESKDKYYLYKHIDEFHQLRYTLTEVYQNEYGYDSSMQKEYIHFATEQLLVLCESCLCTAFVLVLLTSSSLKKRNQEFALLRGIGMTSRQLFLMVVYEILFTSMIAMIVGFILSIGLSYGWMLYLNTQYHVFVFKIDILKNIGLLFLLMGLVFSSLLFPIFSSTKQALSGVFGEKTFHYIQVRYHLLKKQTKLRLAYRDLISNQMLTFSTFLFICILVVFFMTLSSSPKENLQKDQTEYQNLHYSEIIVDKDNRRKV